MVKQLSNLSIFEFLKIIAKTPDEIYFQLAKETEVKWSMAIALHFSLAKVIYLPRYIFGGHDGPHTRI